MENCECERKKLIERNSEDKKALTNRMNRIIGQMNGVKKMIEEDRYCQDVLVQLLAIEKSIRSLSSTILDEHVHSCLINRIQNGEVEAADEISELFKKF